jgi:cathepsin L
MRTSQASRQRGDLHETVDWAAGDDSRPALQALDTSAALDQGMCGSCWAFAAISLLRAHYEIKTKTMRAFSPQQLVSCVSNPKSCGGTGGCHGASAELALRYVQDIGLDNLRSESEYPYTATDSKCKVSSKPSSGGKLSLVTKLVTANNANDLMAALMQGPASVSVAPQGMKMSWHTYQGGIYNDCPSDVVISHGVLAVGYGIDTGNSGHKYWKIRNSWGASWGEHGYIRLLRGDTAEEDSPGRCGWDFEPEKGISCKPYPDKVKVCGMCGILYHPVSVELSDSSGSGNASKSLDAELLAALAELDDEEEHYMHDEDM